MISTEISSTLVLNDRCGRLGNRLFQVAATIATAKKNNLNYGFGFVPYNSYYFNNPIEPIVTNIPEKKYFQECFNYYEIKINESTDFRGYYQSEKFFLNIKNEILNLFLFKNEIEEKLFNKYSFINNTCSIHVRRGDYINMPYHHPVMPVEYFKKAITFTSCKEFTVFSDDIQWCKDNFKFLNAKFISSDVYEDLILMSLCKDNIISNSTFSWWAAYLNKNKNKNVIAPHYKKWFGKNYSNLNTEDIYPSEWTQIEYES